jgi:alpha-galactosidase
MNRRTFCASLLATSTVVSLGGEARAGSGASPSRGTPAGPGAFVLRVPDLVTVFFEGGQADLRHAGNGVWQAPGLEVLTTPAGGQLHVTLAAPTVAAIRLRLRWHVDLSATRAFLGDHWERSYGDLEWRSEVPNRPMPWYFMAWNGTATAAFGVATAPSAFCFWNADRAGVTLWADVRSGGVGVQLGARVLPVCDVCVRPGRQGESPFAATRAFCRQMCRTPLLPKEPVYGTNDWYYAYGDSHPDVLLDTTKLIVSLSPDGGNRPWSVIDDGWSPDGPEKGMWDRGNARFGDMAVFADKISETGALPGIWFRPLLAAQARPASLRMTRDPRFFDPTIPDALAIVAEDTRRLRAWGYRLIKHDYSSFDICGRWGFDMMPAVTGDTWQFADRSRTTAEIVLALYRTLREAAGDALLIGCNTFTHLSAGQFEINRIGDDVSGASWDRTRRMGVNTMAFRAAHHGTFYAADPDIAPITSKHPWDKGKQWLQLLAASGMPAFVSPELRAVDADVRRELKAAFALAAIEQPVPEPLDWLETTCPRRWRLGGRSAVFDWMTPEGPWPFKD